MFSHRIPASFALGLPLTLLSHMAAADCQDTGTPADPVITCDQQPGPELDGIEDDRNDLTVDILGGAVVTATGKPVVQLSGDGFILVENAGSITGAAEAITLAGNSNFTEVLNQPTGSIVSTAAGAIEVGATGGGSTDLINRGLISAQGDAIRFIKPNLLENRPGGRIESATGRGVVSESPDDFSLLFNLGVIESFAEGIRAEFDSDIGNGITSDTFPTVERDARLVVTGTRVIDGETVGFPGISANGGVIRNAATIVATGPGIFVGDGFPGTDIIFVVNEGGRITSSLDDGVRLEPFGVGTPASGLPEFLNSGEITGAKAGVRMGNGRLENSGLITTISTDPAMAGIMVDGVDGNGIPALPITIANGNRFDLASEPGGTIRGMIGILFDDASTAEQQIFNAGVIEGIGGTAIRFAPGQGASTLTLAGESQILGDVIFGGAADLLVVDQITSGVLINSTFDGGPGTDTADLTAYLLSDVSNLVRRPLERVTFDLLAANGDLLMADFTRFEQFEFADGGFAIDDLTPIPVPPALPLLGAALAGLALLRRREA